MEIKMTLNVPVHFRYISDFWVLNTIYVFFFVKYIL